MVDTPGQVRALAQRDLHGRQEASKECGRRSNVFRATVSARMLTCITAVDGPFRGIRPKIWDIDFDFGWTYLQYPGEAEGASTDHRETFARGNYKLTDAVSIAAGFAYSPSASNTGAWSKYAATGLPALRWEASSCRPIRPPN